MGNSVSCCSDSSSSKDKIHNENTKKLVVGNINGNDITSAHIREILDEILVGHLDESLLWKNPLFGFLVPESEFSNTTGAEAVIARAILTCCKIQDVVPGIQFSFKMESPNGLKQQFFVTTHVNTSPLSSPRIETDKPELHHEFSGIDVPREWFRPDGNLKSFTIGGRNIAVDANERVSIINRAQKLEGGGDAAAAVNSSSLFSVLPGETSLPDTVPDSTPRSESDAQAKFSWIPTANELLPNNFFKRFETIVNKFIQNCHEASPIKQMTAEDYQALLNDPLIVAIAQNRELVKNEVVANRQKLPKRSHNLDEAMNRSINNWFEILLKCVMTAIHNATTTDPQQLVAARNECIKAVREVYNEIKFKDTTHFPSPLDRGYTPPPADESTATTSAVASREDSLSVAPGKSVGNPLHS